MASSSGSPTPSSPSPTSKVRPNPFATRADTEREVARLNTPPPGETESYTDIFGTKHCFKKWRGQSSPHVAMMQNITDTVSTWGPFMIRFFKALCNVNDWRGSPKSNSGGAFYLMKQWKIKDHTGKLVEDIWELRFLNNGVPLEFINELWKESRLKE